MIACRLGFHKLEKFMGPQNRGNGRFEQQYKCKNCGKMKSKTS